MLALPPPISTQTGLLSGPIRLALSASTCWLKLSSVRDEDGDPREGCAEDVSYQHPIEVKWKISFLKRTTPTTANPILDASCMSLSTITLHTIARSSNEPLSQKAIARGTFLRENYTLIDQMQLITNVGRPYTNPALFHTCLCHWQEAIRHGSRPTPVENCTSKKQTNYTPLYASDCPQTDIATELSTQ